MHIVLKHSRPTQFPAQIMPPFSESVGSSCIHAKFDWKGQIQHRVQYHRRDSIFFECCFQFLKKTNRSESLGISLSRWTPRCLEKLVLAFHTMYYALIWHQH